MEYVVGQILLVAWARGGSGSFVLLLLHFEAQWLHQARLLLLQQELLVEGGWNDHAAHGIGCLLG